MIKKLRVTVDGKPYEVTVEVPDEPNAPAPAAAPSPVSTPVSAPVASAPAAAPASAPKAGAGPGDIVCPMGGRVVAIDAKVGQDVKEGDRLITTETMKMNTFICAHKSGKVAEILVAVGDPVEEGKVLARIA